MPKCKECGFEASRLQWTHFRYNCSGRFKNGTDYLKSYPNEILVDKDLSKRTAVTLNNFIKKYGEKEGTDKWEAYKQKQAYSNTFEYKKNVHGWNEEKFSEYNKSRAVTLNNMISRHGEEEGIKLWDEYCERQAYTNSLEYLIEKYGKVKGLLKFKEINKKKSESHDPVAIAHKSNISIDEAVELILNRQNLKYFSQLEREFVNLIESITGKLDHTSFNKPFGKWCHELETYLIYDIKHNNCIVEFNGNYWHADPKIYNHDHMIRHRSAQEIWKRDEIKIKLAKELGYNVIVIWEDEFLKDKVNTAKKVAEWILKEHL